MTRKFQFDLRSWFVFECVFFASTIWSVATSIIVPKLKSLPKADEIIAFANWPERRPNPAYVPTLSKSSRDISPESPAERYLLEESCLKKFLEFGQLEASFADASKFGWTQLKDVSLPMGVFFTSKQGAFYWQIRNEHFLDLWNQNGRTATVSLADGCLPVANYPTNKLLTLPKRDDVVSIIATNNLYRDRSPFQDSLNERLRKEETRNNPDRVFPHPPPPKVEEEMLFRFLDLGKPQPTTYQKRWFTSYTRPNGGLVLRDRRILYYELREPKLLFLEAEDGSSCAVRLD